MTYVFIGIILFLLYMLFCACKYADQQKRQAAEYRKVAVYLEHKYCGKSIIEEREKQITTECRKDGRK